MFKVTPNPPKADSTSSCKADTGSKKYDEATNRALDYYLLPKQEQSQDAPKQGQLFTIVKDIDNECLLANLSETLASADAMVSDLAFELDGSRRHIALGIQQLIELSYLLANRVLDNVDPR
ncbi:DUF6124 family protein [Pseudomonas corrugata]|uniref:DUF3077 domain-containing protein n=1 Tax=Pseudomonas corrugata TaxID=47879 RepID=A0A3M3EP80_9PSED|nr:DUF6124 family protein [Pseudomonas corrugata]AOE64811.1 hypothetical protein AXG94_24570 [Pseudomonas corrugata]MDU9021152.1 DUF6124 family protein [Pseudomonas corrugata]MDU9031854.1 DUF6124 family protein [Pseudomonas corrugata]MDU9037379.1 DUF6124 family protein [Pseudomonas corrugata]QTH16154.1 hypothetical protein C4C32_09710 [Pseudomonas corrugata]